MRYYETTFFADEGEPVNAHIRIISDDKWPITLSINGKKGLYENPRVMFHMTERGLINFKNSVLASYKQYLKEKGREK